MIDGVGGRSHVETSRCFFLDVFDTLREIMQDLRARPALLSFELGVFFG